MYMRVNVLVIRTQVSGKCSCIIFLLVEMSRSVGVCVIEATSDTNSIQKVFSLSLSLSLS